MFRRSIAFALILFVAVEVQIAAFLQPLEATSIAHVPVELRNPPKETEEEILGSKSITKKSPQPQKGMPHGMLESLTYNLWTLPNPWLEKIAGERKNKRIGIQFTTSECLLYVAGYLSLGVLAFTFFFEKWTVLDSLYFSVACIFTVGYGDLCPVTMPGRLFASIFGFIGIAFLGTAVATIGSNLVHAEIDAASKARRLFRDRVMALHEDMPQTIKTFRNSTEEKMKEIVDDIRELPPWRLVQASRITQPITKRFLPLLATALVGGLIMGRLNKSTWGLVESGYYSLITASTIGLGDFTPQTKAARIFGVFFIPLSVATAGEFISKITGQVVEFRQKCAFQQFVDNCDLSFQQLEDMDTDNDGTVSREEYVYYMLVQMGLVDKKELEELFAQYDRLDITGNGMLDREDLKLMAKLRGVPVKDD